jgi:hypothetical protein
VAIITHVLGIIGFYYLLFPLTDPTLYGCFFVQLYEPVQGTLSQAAAATAAISLTV